MKKLILLILCIVFVVSLYGLYLIYHPTPVSQSSKLASIVRLVDAKGHTFCSGTVVSDDTIITAAHCIVDCPSFGSCFLREDKFYIRPGDNKDLNISARAAYTNPQLDYGAVAGDFRVFAHSPHTSDIKEILRYVEETLVACGYPLNGAMFCTTFDFKEQYGFAWTGDGTTLPGMSGGPLLTPNGVVIGVVTGMIDDLAIMSPIFNFDSNYPLLREKK